MRQRDIFSAIERLLWFHSDSGGACDKHIKLMIFYSFRGKRCLAAASFVPSITAIVHWQIFHLDLQWRILPVPSPAAIGLALSDLLDIYPTSQTY